jgi:valyl-tRNA synthetase
MHEAGLIYAGEYLVNWDPKGQTTVSDEELEYETEKTTLYTFKYSKLSPIPIATTRPETKLGDTALAVHPKSKWSKFIGQKFTVENFAGVKLKIEIIGDDAVDPEFGTGAVGVTPAHSKIDGEMAKRHNLPTKQVINEFGKIANTGTELDGKNIKEAREKIIEWLKKENLLEKEEAIEHNIAKAQRSGGVVEILPKRHQFFIDVNKSIKERGGKSLKDLTREAVESGKIKIIPERFEKEYFHWIDNLHDWNISRQIWYGHKIPAWYKNDETKVTDESPGEGWAEINDTFDTWFSSGLWTFSALGWPEKTSDLKKYHPTDLLETGYDILFFWVAKMILMSEFLMGEVPFKNVYLHGLVRDEQRRKMSKSLGNVINPLDMTVKYGTDALRLALVFNTAPGMDTSISEAKIKGMKHFANKLWNITRFILSNVKTRYDANFSAYTEEDEKIRKERHQLLMGMTKDLESYDLHLAAEKIYQYTWHTFADKIIEESKAILKNGSDEEKASREQLLLHTLEKILIALHPFMPFVTEKIWESFPKGNGQDLLIIEEWPRP